MHDRRRRIMDETRELIAEKGFDGFSMRELGLRAEVAQRTLYNAFENKDHLIALAVKEYYEQFVARMTYRNPPQTLEGLVERLVRVHARNRSLKNYVRAVMAVYFSSSVPEELWSTIHGISADNYKVWLSELRRRRQLQPWVDIDNGANLLARLEYASVHEWSEGRVSDAAFISHLLAAVLTLAAGMARGEALKEIGAAVANPEKFTA
jgi:AcrR family transcriptional regulator